MAARQFLVPEVRALDHRLTSPSADTRDNLIPNLLDKPGASDDLI
jgi:hypothetical protein